MAHILIIDDEQSIRRLLKEILEAAGYRCVMAADAAEARKYLKNESFELVLSDIDMPGESGLEFAEFTLGPA